VLSPRLSRTLNEQFSATLPQVGRQLVSTSSAMREHQAL
jgi:hypothetical protein